MRFLFLFSVFLVWWQQEIAAQPYPYLNFDMEYVNYGVIKQHGCGKAVLRIMNSGGEPLILKSFESDNSQVKGFLPKNDLIAGQSAYLEFLVDTEKIGFFTAKVTLITNQYPAHIRPVQVFGFVFPSVKLPYPFDKPYCP